MKVPLIIDYCTLNVPENTFDISSLSEYIAGENLTFKPVGKSESPNRFISPFGIDFQVNGGFNREQVIRFSGKGCENFPYSIYKIHNEYNARISRLDITFDTDLSIDEWHNYLSDVFSEYMKSDRKAKVYNLITGTEKDAATVLIGSRRSPFYFRIYNKTLEQKQKSVNDKYTIRFECELKRFTRTIRDEKQIYDPSFQYELYWNDINKLAELIKSYWKSYAPVVCLPYCWDDIEFCYPDTIKILFNTEQKTKEHIQRDYALKNIKDFNSSLLYVVSRFGHYLPFIMDDDMLLKDCIRLCSEKHGMLFNIEKQIFVEYNDNDTWNDVVSEYDYSKEQIKI